jgi:hypothetical protein
VAIRSRRRSSRGATRCCLTPSPISTATRRYEVGQGAPRQVVDDDHARVELRDPQRPHQVRADAPRTTGDHDLHPDLPARPNRRWRTATPRWRPAWPTATPVATGLADRDPGGDRPGGPLDQSRRANVRGRTAAWALGPPLGVTDPTPGHGVAPGDPASRGRMVYSSRYRHGQATDINALANRSTPVTNGSQRHRSAWESAGKGCR